MKVTSSQVAFVGGRRYRPGEVFEIPDDAKLAPAMTKVAEGAPKGKGAKAEQVAGDTKPADAAKAAQAKTGGQNDTTAKADSKPDDAAKAAQGKAGNEAAGLV